MKRISYIIAAAMAMISSIACSVDEIDNPSVEKTPLVFTASFDATKANINENGKFSWAAGDKIKVINAEGASEEVTLTADDIVEGVATFTTTSLDESETYYAVYPSSNYKSLTDGNLTVGPKTIQAAADQKTCVSVCSDNEMNFCFHNTACLIKFETEINFSQAVFSATGNEHIHSTYTVNPTTGEMGTVVGEEGNQVYVNRDGKTGPYFFELAPGVTMASGFTIELRDAGKNVLATYTNTNSITTARNKILNVKNFDSRIDGKYTVTLSDDPENPLSSVDGKVTLPSREGNDTYTFAGWTTSNIAEETTDAPIIIPAGAYAPQADVTLYPVYSRVDSGSKTSSVVISDYASAHNWQGGGAEAYKSITIDNNITVSTTGTTNNGKYYGDWRLYQVGGGNLIITAATGCTISSAIITFTTSNGGKLSYNGNTVESETAVALSSNSATFTVGNTGTATNGQVRVSEISVTYKTSANPVTYYVSNISGSGEGGDEGDDEDDDEGGSYTITFGNKVASATAISSTVKANTVISDGTDYVTASPFTVSAGNAYYGDTQTCIRLGKSGNAATLTIALSDKGKVKASSIVVNAMNIGGNKNIGATLSANGADAQVTSDSNAADYTFTINAESDIDAISLSTSAAVYIYSITVNY